MSLFGSKAPTPEEFVRENEVKKALTSKFSQVLKSLQQEHIDSDEPIHSGDSANAVCNVLEAIFLHGLKGSIAKKISHYFSGTPDATPSQLNFWRFLTPFTHKDVVSQLNHLGQITTEIGMCRAWIRVAINDGILESYIDAMLADTKTVSYWYKRTAYLRDTEQVDILKTYVQGLLNFKFQLSYNSSLLNVWTITPLILSGIWVPPQTPAAVVGQRPVINRPPADAQTSSQPSVSAQPVIVHKPKQKSRKAALPSTPPNTPYDNTQITNKDIEEIKKLTFARGNYAGSESSTASHISCPDPSGLRNSALPGSLGGYSQSPLNEIEAAFRRSNIEERILKVSEDMLEHKRNEKDEVDDGLESAKCDAESGATSTDNGNQQHTTQINTKEVGKHGKFKLPHEMNKSAPLEVVLNNTTVTDVDMATDVTTDPQLISTRQRHGSSIYDSRDEAFTTSADLDNSESGIPFGYKNPHRGSYGNSLGKMSGWSSSFEDSTSIPASETKPEGKPEPVEQDVPSERERELSFDSLMRNYSPPGGHTSPVNLSAVLGDLHSSDEHTEDMLASSPVAIPSQTPGSKSNSSNDLNFEVVPISSSVTSENADSRMSALVSVIGMICTEKGLDMQNYQCKGCSRPIGMIYGKARVCGYDACYYCYECHENQEAYIPGRIVQNWDFRKQKVCNFTKTFLDQVQEQPLINVKECNVRLYDHVNEMNDVKLLRYQLRYLKSYLFTCSQTVADDLRKMVWPREYLYDNVHLYSLTDLLQVQSGQLAQNLKKIIKYASKHVYECRLCNQKGFICEICDNPKVIFPFETESTYRCDNCHTVFHKDCQSDAKPCPKCERRKHRQALLGTGVTTPDIDYGYGMSDFTPDMSPL